MKIRELIASLEKMDPEKDITIYVDDEGPGWYYHVADVTRPAVDWDESTYGEYQHTAVIKLGRAFDNRGDV